MGATKPDANEQPTPTEKASAFQRLALMTDDAVIELAKKFARYTSKRKIELDDELREKIAAKFTIGSARKVTATQAEAARAALVLAADTDPKKVMDYADAPEAQGVLAAIALMTAVLVILQTEIKITGKKGAWQVDVHKRPTSDGLLKGFIKSVLGLS